MSLAEFFPRDLVKDVLDYLKTFFCQPVKESIVNSFPPEFIRKLLLIIFFGGDYFLYDMSGDAEDHTQTPISGLVALLVDLWGYFLYLCYLNARQEQYIYDFVAEIPSYISAALFNHDVIRELYERLMDPENDLVFMWVTHLYQRTDEEP